MGYDAVVFEVDLLGAEPSHMAAYNSSGAAEGKTQAQRGMRSLTDCIAALMEVE